MGRGPWSGDEVLQGRAAYSRLPGVEQRHPRLQRTNALDWPAGGCLGEVPGAGLLADTPPGQWALGWARQTRQGSHEIFGKDGPPWLGIPGRSEPLMQGTSRHGEGSIKACSHCFVPPAFCLPPHSPSPISFPAMAFEAFLFPPQIIRFLPSCILKQARLTVCLLLPFSGCSAQQHTALFEPFPFG